MTADVTLLIHHYCNALTGPTGLVVPSPRALFAGVISIRSLMWIVETHKAFDITYGYKACLLLFWQCSSVIKIISVVVDPSKILSCAMLVDVLVRTKMGYMKMSHAM